MQQFVQRIGISLHVLGYYRKLREPALDDSQQGIPLFIGKLFKMSSSTDA